MDVMGAVLLPILPACGFPEGLWPEEETSGSSSAPAVIVPILGSRVSLGSGEVPCFMFSGNGHPKDLSKGLLLPVLAQGPDPGKGGSTPAGDDSSPSSLLLVALLSAHPQCSSPAPCPFHPPVPTPSGVPAGTSMRPERHLEAAFQHGLPRVLSFPGQGLSHLILSRR